MGGHGASLSAPLPVEWREPGASLRHSCTTRGDPMGVSHVDDDVLGIITNGMIGSDVPAWLYLVCDESGALSAIVLALVNDYALAGRPAADDAALVEHLHALAVHADQDGDAYDS